MWQSPVLLAPLPPAADDPVVGSILNGLLQATGARGCRLAIQLLPDRLAAGYESGRAAGLTVLQIPLDGGDRFCGELQLFFTQRRAAAAAATVERLRPLVEGAVLALIDRTNASRQMEILVEILGVGEEATFLIDRAGEILFANPRGEELLALHTERPQARLGDAPAGPLLSLIVSEIAELYASDERVRRQTLTTGDGSRWRLEIVALAGRGASASSLVVLSPARLLEADEIRRRLCGAQVSRREAEVLAALLRGQRAAEIAAHLGITEYTVKDHLKHAYAKLGISSRGQLLARLAAVVPGAS